MQEALHLFRYKGSKPIGFVHLTVVYEKVENVWVAECQELGTVTEADDIEAARRELRHAVALQLTQTDELGSIDEFLRAHGVPAAGW